MTVISAMIYDFLAKKVGGLKVKLSMENIKFNQRGRKVIEVKKVDIWSAVRIQTILISIISLVIAIFLFCIGLVANDTSLMIVAILMPILYTIICAIIMSIMLAIYNFIANKIGGLKMTLSGEFFEDATIDVEENESNGFNESIEIG